MILLLLLAVIPKTILSSLSPNPSAPKSLQGLTKFPKPELEFGLGLTHTHWQIKAPSSKSASSLNIPKPNFGLKESLSPEIGSPFWHKLVSGLVASRLTFTPHGPLTSPKNEIALGERRNSSSSFIHVSSLQSSSFRSSVFKLSPRSL